MAELTDKQQRFCEEYLIDMNATQAAIRAGYSGKTAQAIGAENLTKPLIKKFISDAQKEASKKLGVTADMVKAELKKIGFSNIQNYFEGDLTPKDLLKIPARRAAAIASIKKTVTTYEGGKTEVVEFKLHNKVQSLELLGKHLGFFEKDNTQSAAKFSIDDAHYKIVRRKKS